MRQAEVVAGANAASAKAEKAVDEAKAAAVKADKAEKKADIAIEEAAQASDYSLSSKTAVEKLHGQIYAIRDQLSESVSFVAQHPIILSSPAKK